MSKTKIDMIRVDRKEYEAIKEVAERSNYEIAKACAALDSAKLLAARHEENYRACVSINRDQVARLNAQDLQLADARRRADVAERECARLTKELDEARKAAAK